MFIIQLPYVNEVSVAKIQAERSSSETGSSGFKEEEQVSAAIRGEAVQNTGVVRDGVSAYINRTEDHQRPEIST